MKRPSPDSRASFWFSAPFPTTSPVKSVRLIFTTSNRGQKPNAIFKTGEGESTNPLGLRNRRVTRRIGECPTLVCIPLSDAARRSADRSSLRLLPASRYFGFDLVD
jgi:hypothetical protein